VHILVVNKFTDCTNFISLKSIHRYPHIHTNFLTIELAAVA